MNKIFSPFVSLKKSARTVFAIAIVLSLPITLFLAKNPQDTRQFAAENTSVNTPIQPIEMVQTASDRADYAFTIPSQADFVTKLKDINIFGSNITSLVGSTNNTPLTNITVHLTTQPQKQTIFIDPVSKLPTVTADLKISPGKADVTIAYAPTELNTSNLNAAAKKADYAVFILLYSITHPVKAAAEVKNRDQALTILLQGLPTSGYLKLMKL